MKKEIWKSIKGYEGFYEISNFGNVKSLKCGKERLLSSFPNTRGYLRVNLFKDKKIKTVYIHRLVSEAFIREIKINEQVNHIDKDKTNNSLDNLEIIAQYENLLHEQNCKIYKTKGIISFLHMKIKHSHTNEEKQAYVTVLNYIKNKK